MDRLRQTTEQAERDRFFAQTLDSMEKGSLKRDDFLHKFASAVEVLTPDSAKSLGEAAVKSAAKYSYDSVFPFVGEAGYILVMIGAIANRLSGTERVAFLQTCIQIATDDTMSFRILTALTNKQFPSHVNVAIVDLYGSFAMRMRKLYGRNVDAANFDLSTSDSWAFEYWGRDLRPSGIMTDPEDRKIQSEFWLRYIGQSRSRLARAFREFFLPMAAYSEDPSPFVSNRIDLANLRRLYEELPQDPTLTENDQKALNALRRLLDGDFKNGVNPTQDIW